MTIIITTLIINSRKRKLLKIMVLLFGASLIEDWAVQAREAWNTRTIKPLASKSIMVLQFIILMVIFDIGLPI